jgi:Flp pilus assembly protein TadG
MLARRHLQARRGVSAVEMAVVTVAILLPTIIGLWEVGRLIYVTQVVSHAAREGARLAAQAYTINSSGQVVEIRRAAGVPNVTNTVYQTLRAGGLAQLQPTDVNVEFQFTSGDTSRTEPYQGERGQTFFVRVTVPWSRVRLINLGLINPTQVQFTAHWQMLIDERFSINDQLPPW